MFLKEHFAKVRILKTYQQPLKDMKHEEYKEEGGYTKEAFVRVWGEDKWVL